MRGQVSKRVLTKSEEYGIAVYYACGVPVTGISHHFNLSRSGIHRVLTRLGVETERGKKSVIRG